ncbi:Serine/threonine-protein kinase [Microthyrium microscopicum]|uniref:non-specific serine/threonine protein kinase n=1 Tax=Microthyrium microscopicum TaxID=703497 RepID=A0A6A6UA09_9PEZI|nr:Serine/threonine-protein kinase [Microthyrium microscopicum]
MAKKNKKAVNRKETEAASDAPLHNATTTAVKSKTRVTDYAQLQSEELVALEGIYFDQFERVEQKGAWNSSQEPTFKIHLKSDPDEEIRLVLFVKFTLTYPKSPPIITIESSTGVRDKTLKLVMQTIATDVDLRLGDVMIYEIAFAVQGMLDNEAHHKAHGETLTSLEEERAEYEAAAFKAAKEQELKEQEKHAQAQAEEDQNVQRMVAEEMARRKQTHEPRRRSRFDLMSDHTQAAGRFLTFDRIVHLQKEGIDISFFAVNGFAQLADGPVTSIQTVLPIAEVPTPGKVASPCQLILKQCFLNLVSAEEKKKILLLEELLESVRRLPIHVNCIRMLDFRIDSTDLGWDVLVLTEHARQDTLWEKLQEQDVIYPKRVKSWTIDLLGALEFYHKHGIVHGDLHSKNVLFERGDGGSQTLKLADAGFQKALHDLRNKSSASSARAVYWQAPELQNDGKPIKKSDIWDLGILFVQMLFGLDVPERFNGPSMLSSQLKLSDPLKIITHAFFKVDSKKRPTAFDLSSNEFLRTDVAVYAVDVPSKSSGFAPAIFDMQPRRRRLSSIRIGSSRFEREFDYLGRLGKGGFGEVVKARHKLDGQTYAIKKIEAPARDAFTQLLSEVKLLSRIDHQNVVRYWTAWFDDSFDEDGGTKNASSEDQTSQAILSTEEDNFTFGHSTRGLDFVSSGPANIAFGSDSSSDSEEDDEQTELDDQEDESAVITGSENGSEDLSSETSSTRRKLAKQRTISSSRSMREPMKTTLYIQMEYCERHTLLDLIRKGLNDEPDNIWRLFHQIVDGLAHIHSLGIIHRDLKPANIFIDQLNNPKIGDFGLAISGQFDSPGKGHTNNVADNDMTRSVGTAFYVAPEVKSSSSGDYSTKVDMYSLGIIFFEMCYPLTTGMERAKVMGDIRAKGVVLPDDFETPEKSAMRDILESLLVHQPSKRPSSYELLHSGKIPIKVKDEALQQALLGLRDRASPYYHNMIESVFSVDQADQDVQDLAWDAASPSRTKDEPILMLVSSMTKDRLAEIFKKHCAIETQRPILFPRSRLYTTEQAVHVLTSTGTVAQLPFDLTLPNARKVARTFPGAEKTYTIGTVFRDSKNGGEPLAKGEVDFDFVSTDALDLAMRESEVIKVLDEVVHELPCFSPGQMCLHLNHSALLELILEHCRIPVHQRTSVKEVLSNLNVNDNTWQRLRNELRAPSLGITSTSLDDLAKFDWRETHDKALTKVQSIMGSADQRERLKPTFAHLQAVVKFMKNYGVQSKVYICPLSCYKEKFYQDGILFQCLYDSKKRTVLAAGGRYDRLIEDNRPRHGNAAFTGCHAVGFSLSWERLMSSMVKHQKGATKSSKFLKKTKTNNAAKEIWPMRRGSVLVASFDAKTLRSAAMSVVKDLWSHGISAELAKDADSLKELTTRYHDDPFSWIVMIKQDTAFARSDLKVRSFITGQDVDVSIENLIPHLRTEIRERDQREGQSTRVAHRPLSALAGNVDSGYASSDKRTNFQLIFAQHKGKKTNRNSLMEAGLLRYQEFLASYANPPYVGVETSDAILEAVRASQLGDPDSWRRAIQSAPANDRDYIQQIRAMLDKFRGEYLENGACQKAVIFNFRTGWIDLYDLAL